MLYIMHKYQHVSSMLEPVVEAGSEGEDCNETGSVNLEEEDEERAWALAEGTGGEDGDGGGGEQQMFAPYPSATLCSLPHSLRPLLLHALPSGGHATTTDVDAAIPQPLFMPTSAASPQPLFIPQLIDLASLPSSHSASPVHRQSYQPTSPPQPLLRHFPRPHPTSLSPQLQRHGSRGPKSTRWSSPTYR